MPTFTTTEPITATLTTGGAQVRVVASERSDTVVVVEPINSANKSDVKIAEKTTVEFAGGELSIKTLKSGDRNGSVAITVELPVRSRLVLNTAWTDVHAVGVLGDCELNTASGQVQLDHIAGNVIVENGAAGVRIGEVEGIVRYEGSNGRIWIGHALADVELNGAGGSFDIERAEGSVIAKAGNCPIRIGQLTRGQADLANASGGIDVGISDGTAAEVDAKSTKGAVRNSLPVQDSAGAANKLKLHARTRLDDITIHPTTI